LVTVVCFFTKNHTGDRPHTYCSPATEHTGICWLVFGSSPPSSAY
jgi:hypothetical protein